MERYQKTEQRYQALQDEYQKAQNPAIREHLLRNLFPPLAYYQTLRSDGFSQQAALELVEKDMTDLEECRSNNESKNIKIEI